MSYNYSQYVTQLANMLVIPATDPNYLIGLNNIIDDAEQRLYRELDILNTVVRDQTGSLTANSRNFTLPQSAGRFVVTESMNVFTPSGTTTNRNQLIPVTREFLDAIWPNEAAPSVPSVPTYYAMITDQQIIVGPSPDASYTMEVVGTIRPTPFSASNPQTYLTLYLPDVFMAASIVFGYGYMKDFGPMVDDPQGGLTWETHLQKLIASANTEEQRKRYASLAWTPKQPSPLATPPRA
jgi:hypothetical protein